VTWVVNPAVGCRHFPPGPQLPWQPLRGLLPVSLLGERWVWTVCLRLLPDSVAAAILNPDPIYCAWVQHANHLATEPPRRDKYQANNYHWPALDLVAETRCFGLTPTVSDVVLVSGAFGRCSSFGRCTPDAILYSVVYWLPAAIILARRPANINIDVDRIVKYPYRHCSHTMRQGLCIGTVSVCPSVSFVWCNSVRRVCCCGPAGGRSISQFIRQQRAKDHLQAAIYNDYSAR